MALLRSGLLLSPRRGAGSGAVVGVGFLLLTFVCFVSRCRAGTRTERVFFVSSGVVVKVDEKTSNTPWEPRNKVEVVTTIHHIPSAVPDVNNEVDGGDGNNLNAGTVAKEPGEAADGDNNTVDGTDEKEQLQEPAEEQQQQQRQQQRQVTSSSSTSSVSSSEQEESSQERLQGSGNDGDEEGASSFPGTMRFPREGRKGKWERKTTSRRRGRDWLKQLKRRAARRTAGPSDYLPGYAAGGWKSLKGETKVRVLERCAAKLAKLQVRVFLALQTERRKLERTRALTAAAIN